jgi:drug/metabolite transporter (DMT)-like permease
MLLLARIVRLAAGIAIGLIVVGIALVVLGANESNSLVSTLLDGARWLVQPFKNVFHLDNAKTNIAVNWGLAAVVYAAVAAVIVRLLVAAGAASVTRRRAYFRRSAY